MEVITDYIESKMRDIKAYEGTSIAHEAKDELRNHLATLQKNDTLFQELKDQNKEVIKEAQKMFQEQQQSMKIRGMSLGMWEKNEGSLKSILRNPQNHNQGLIHTAAT